MNTALILQGGRSGSDLLQSLFDSHPEILQFPGILRFDQKFLKIFNIKSTEQIALYFIKVNPQFFDSRLNKIERHNKLGQDKKGYFKVNKKKFIKFFHIYFNKSKKTNFDLLVCLHKAYNFNKKKNKKLLIVHIHIYDYLLNYLDIIGEKNNLKILLTLRDPLVSLSSAINHFLNYKKGIAMSPRGLYEILRIHFNTFNDLHFLRKKIRVVKLEEKHNNSIITMKKICKFLKIKFVNSLLKSTYHGKKWWGDAVSKKYLNGLNKNFQNKFDEKLFTYKEVFYLESKLFPILKKYNYPLRSKAKQENISYYLIFFGFEKKVWKNVLKNNSIKTILSILYFFIKRLFLLSKKNIFNLKNLPSKV